MSRSRSCSCPPSAAASRSPASGCGPGGATAGRAAWCAVSCAAVPVDIRDVAPGLWLWRQPHPDWREGFDWEPDVISVAVESRGTRLVLDPLAPPPAEREVWDRLEALRPEVVVILKPDHVRDVDLFVRWYGAAAYGPFLFWRDDIPRVELTPVEAGDELPGGVQALEDGRGRMETPVYLPEQRA